MNNDPYNEWLADQRRVLAPEQFTDGVMAALKVSRPAWKTPLFWARAALFTLAVVGGIGRYAVALFFILFAN